MNVKNRKCIRKLSLKSLYANRRRNLIAIFAIALTTLLFTSMFTIVLSLNASYETYQFRQVGGYAHGTFKDVSPEQAERIAAHPKVKATGVRKVIGITAEGVFAKIPAEISYMPEHWVPARQALLRVMKCFVRPQRLPVPCSGSIQTDCS